MPRATSPVATPSAEKEAQPPARRRNEPPERKIGPFANGVGVCIWLNQTQGEQAARSFHTITINPRRYFDRESNQWKDASSFNASDLPALIYSLQLAAKYCFEQNPSEQADGEGQPGNGDDIPY
jgi:hypothetical protein